MILERIVAHTRAELAARQAARPLAELKSRGADRSHPLDLAAALRGDGVALIAEVKRASPSKGVFAPDLDAPALARTYAENGARAISVLTDGRFFHGELGDLARIKAAVSLPVLRKDFIVDPYQVHESYAYGADGLLLIAAVLGDGRLAKLLALTRELGMAALVEVHDGVEAARVRPLGPRLVGINNRNLQDFSVDLGTFARLRPALPTESVVVAESGVRGAADVRYLARAGADAVLVGEALVTAPDPAAKVRELAGM
jgi:indole-3-glycerol phosphate synthase